MAPGKSKKTTKAPTKALAKKRPARRKPASLPSSAVVIKRDTIGVPVVGIVMGSDSDLGVMRQAAECLEMFGIGYELRIVSAHRTPELVMAFGGTARSRGLRVIIAGAGGAAHLPGMMAAHTSIPVIGVPVPIGPLQGQDALYSIVQMPKGVPVATMAIGGAWNAGVLAAQILSLGTGPEAQRVAGELEEYKAELERNVAKMNERMNG